VQVERQSRQLPPMNRADSAYREGLARFNAGAPTDAARLFRAALAEDPGHRPAREALVALLVERQEWTQALAVLGETLASNPAQPAYALLAARIQARNGDREAALGTLRAAATPSAPGELFATLAGLLGEMKRDREATTYWSAALKRAPDRSPWWLGFAIALEADGRGADARLAYERALALGGLRADGADYARSRMAALR
jgi:MSHA biogenesis protein MshN